MSAETTDSAFDNYFLQAQRVRQLVKNDFDAVFRIPDVRNGGELVETDDLQPNVDVLLHPSAIGSAPSLSSEPNPSSSSALDAYVQDLLTVPASLAGLPALSVPCPSPAPGERGGDDGWPVGFSVIGQWGTDNLVLEVGEAISSLMRESR